ncbi:MAG: hypothetical protein KC466_05630, partial [Myxococcales bacterium]|nr:hypothetical protein [Myxococcales bacterium]
LLYFAYVRKTVAGTPLVTSGTGAIDDCATSSPYSTPSDPDQPLCKCVEAPDENTAPKGCWLPWCYDPDPQFVGTPNPGTNCKEACNDDHIEGTDDGNDECLPFSVLYCANPKESETSSVDGVDVYEFGIGRARREHWDVSIAVVEAQ